MIASSAAIEEPSIPLRSQVCAVALSGLVATLVTITVTIAPGPRAFELVGVDARDAQSMRRLAGSVLGRAGEQIEASRVEVRVSPRGIRDLDKLYLAIIVALRLALENRSLPDTVLVGDVWPSGHLRPVPGALPALLGARRMSRAIVPRNNGPETACVPGMEVLVATDVREVLNYVRGEGELASARDVESVREPSLDMAEVQEGRRELEVAAAGFHHLFLVGPHRAGAMGLASRLPSVMPELTREEALEVTSIHSVTGRLLEHHLGALTRPPFRSPDSSLSVRRLTGGAYPMRPGEVSLAHHGVLFFNSIQSWRADALAAIDAVLDAGQAVLAGGITFPARPLIVASALPCPCGFFAAKDRTCTCSPDQIRAYRARLRGPVLDRADVRLCMSGSVAGPPGESSAEIRARVVKAREAQRHRFEAGEASEPVNGRLGAAELERVAKLGADGRRALKRAGLVAELSAKALRVARTIADLDGSDAVRGRHVEEAAQFVRQPEI
jgi:magnesium chelatase family protein